MLTSNPSYPIASHRSRAEGKGEVAREGEQAPLQGAHDPAAAAAKPGQLSLQSLQKGGALFRAPAAGVWAAGRWRASATTCQRAGVRGLDCWKGACVGLVLGLVRPLRRC